MKVLSRLKSTPIWALLPAVLLGISLAWAVSSYSPLEFVASLYEADSADAVELDTIDAEVLEDSGEDETLEEVEVAADLTDGTWTGYAACGVGNEDGWKPYYVATTVVVENGSVASISRIAGSSTGDAGSSALSWDASENQEYLDWAISGRTVGGKSYAGVKTQLDSAIAQGKNSSSVDVVSGATYSSEAILNSYSAALAKAGSSESVQSASSSAIGESSETTSYLASENATVSGSLGDGTWTGYAACGIGNEDDWNPYYVAVSVTVSDGAVTEITDIYGTSTADEGSSALSWNADENQTYLDWAISGRTRSGTFYTGVKTQLDEAIDAAGGMPSGIDVVSGATYSCESIFEAYYAALNKSAASVGSTVEEPEDGEADLQDGDEDEDEDSDNGGGSSVDDDSDDDGDSNDGDSNNDADDEGDGGSAGVAVTLIDGTYLGSAFCQDEDNPSEWSPYYVIVELVVEDGKPTTFLRAYGDTQYLISPLYWYNASENGTYFSKALNGTLKKVGVKAQIQNALDAGEVLSDIDVISGATWSSRSLFEAYQDALANAYAAAEEAAEQAGDDAGQTGGSATQAEGDEQ